jgi:hypothetical protein
LVERVRDHLAVVERLRELERALRVLARTFEVTLAPVAPRAPREDLRAELVAREPRPLGEHERLVQEPERGLDRRQAVPADAEPHQDLRALDVRERRGLGGRASAVQELDRLVDLALAHPRVRFRRERPHLQFRQARREYGRAALVDLGQDPFVVALFEQRLRPRERRVDAAALVVGDAVREKAGVDTQPVREPLDRLARGPGLAALDLRDVLLREPVAGEIALRQPRRDAELPQALAEAKPGRLKRGARLMRSCLRRHVDEREVKRTLHQTASATSLASPKKGMFWPKMQSTACGKNHLTELLDSLPLASYSQATCNKAGRQAEACRGLVDTGDRRFESAAGPQSHVFGPSQRATSLRRNRPPEPQPGVFLFGPGGTPGSPGSALLASVGAGSGVGGAGGLARGNRLVPP